MARRNDRIMRIRFVFMMLIGVLTCISVYAQDDIHLKKLTDGLLLLRKEKASSAALNKTILNWSASGCPKITLMDEIKRDPDNEYRGTGANKFKINQLVTHVYNRQNTGMASKGDYFNSTEKDVYYSAIEKTVKKNCTVRYTLTGHSGVQEFIFMSYNPNTKFLAKVNDNPAQPIQGKSGVLYVKLPNVEKDKEMVFSITNNSNANESFVILYHNTQK